MKRAKTKRAAFITAGSLGIAAALPLALLRAAWTLTLHGHPVQHATAHGTYGRATCTTHTRSSDGFRLAAAGCH